jgi:hypothetical protein
MGKLPTLGSKSISSGRAKVTNVTAAVYCRSLQALDHGNGQ